MVKITTFSRLFAPVALLVFVFIGGLRAQSPELTSWPQWRGPIHTGTALFGNPPVNFATDGHLKWRTEIPGRGNATPIVWEDKIIVLTAVPTNEKPADGTAASANAMAPSVAETILEFRVILLNRNNGETIWSRSVARELPHEGTHELGSWASNSPSTDGEHIFAYFGSRGLYCLDFEGNVIWQKRFGKSEKHMSFGEGDSPFLYGDRIFVLWDHQGESFIVALDKRTGEELWRAQRDEVTSWSTPLVVDVNGRLQVITNAPNQVRSYDFESGEVIWYSTGMTRNVIPNPIYSDGILYVMSGFRGSALQAIDIAIAKGDITDSNVILWTYNQDTPYTPNPVLINGKLYFLRVNNGFLTCLDAKTGEVFYAKENIPGISTLFSSPTGVADRIYIASKGVVTVIKASTNFEVIATNPIDDDFHASPVVVGNEIILRGFDALYNYSR